MSGAIKLWNTPFCLDVEGGRRTAGVPLQIWECKLVNSIPIEAQTWSMIDGGSANPPVGTVAPPSGAAPPEQPYLFITQSGQQLSASWLASAGATKYEVELHRVKDIRKFGPRTAEYWDTQKFETSSTSLRIKLDRYIYQSHTSQRVGLRACNTVCSTWHYVDFNQFRPIGKEQKMVFDIVATRFTLSSWSTIAALKPLYFPYSSFENDVCSNSPNKPNVGIITVDFTLACTYHDWMYRNAKRLEREFGFETWNENSRKTYDDSFLFLMTQACEAKYNPGVRCNLCKSIAKKYYNIVRLLGWK
jgi:hypothetical protein